jgi:lipoate-protein ligase A
MWIDDEIIDNCHEALVVKVWVPEASYVVLGSGHNPSLECHTENCASDGVQVLRRYGGGGTVLLYPGCVIVGIGCWVRHHFHNDRYFKILNQAMIELLQNRWPHLDRLQQRGISDIAFDDKKICGTSMFRSRNYLLYQGSLLIEDDIESISAYLAHPSKEPDYRRGKTHGDFLTNLRELVPGLDTTTVASYFRENLSQYVSRALRDEFHPADPHQVIHMKKRSAKGQEESDAAGKLIR